MIGGKIYLKVAMLKHCYRKNRKLLKTNSSFPVSPSAWAAAPDWVGYKQQKCFSRSSESGRKENRALAWLAEALFQQAPSHCLSSLSSLLRTSGSVGPRTAEGAQELLGARCKGAHPGHEAPPSRPTRLLKARPCTSAHWSPGLPHSTWVPHVRRVNSRPLGS